MDNVSAVADTPKEAYYLLMYRMPKPLDLRYNPARHG